MAAPGSGYHAKVFVALVISNRCRHPGTVATRCRFVVLFIPIAADTRERLPREAVFFIFVSEFGGRDALVVVFLQIAAGARERLPRDAVFRRLGDSNRCRHPGAFATRGFFSSL